MNFDRAVTFVLQWEGGEVNDPRDPGGHTKYGISKRAYPHLDITNLTSEQAIGIYQTDYWELVKGDELPFPIALQTFDMAVNAGISAGAKCLQRALRTLADGIIGPSTLSIAKTSDPKVIAPLLTTERILYYTQLDNWPRYGKGWTKRTIAALLEVQ